jgi:hypothetical protein
MGRRPTLTYMERIAVGAAAERLWRAERKKEMDTAYEAAHRTVAVERRKARGARDRGEPLDPDHEDNVLFALATDQYGEGSDDEPSRVVTVKGKRPWGKRDQIKERVAAAATNHYRRAITSRMVDKCWKDFRALEAED